MHICKTTRSLSTVAVGPRLLLQAEPAHLACKSVPLRRLLRACTSSVPLVPVDNVVAGFMGVFHSGDVGQTQASAEECEKSGYAPAGQSNPIPSLGRLPDAHVPQFNVCKAEVLLFRLPGV